MIELNWFINGFIAGIIVVPAYKVIKRVIEEIGYMKKEW